MLEDLVSLPTFSSDTAAAPLPADAHRQHLQLPSGGPQASVVPVGHGVGVIGYGEVLAVHRRSTDDLSVRGFPGLDAVPARAGL